MGKVIFEFDSIEEQNDIRDALDGYKWKMAMWDLDQKLRSTLKYDVSVLNEKKELHVPSVSDIEYDVAEKYRDIIREILEGYNIQLD